jgi:LCP family protein required for cell wall assembly
MVRPPVRSHPHRRQMIFAGRSVAALMAVLALVLTGGAWQWTASTNNNLNKVAALDPNSRDILDPNAQFGDENFLIVGVDSRIGQNSEMGAGGTEDAGGARSDTVMLVNIPADRKRVVGVSFPRDTAITPIKCEAWDPNTGQYGPVWDEDTQSYGPDQVYTETKLNSAYSFGGPKCLVKVIQKISGLSINRFMAIDFAGFAKMVDALGGVEVCSTTPLEDYEIGSVLPVAGRQMIDGHTALNYVRARQVTTEFNGDYGRIKRQQMFLSSLLRSLISKDTFFSLNKLNNVVNMFINDSFVDNIQTKDLVDLGQSIQGVSAGRVSFITLPTAGITDENGDEVPNDTAIRALFDAIINDDPLPGENDNNATSAPVTDSINAQNQSSDAGTDTAPTTEVVNAVTAEPQEVSVHVSNSTGESGLGTTASTALEEHGFSVDSPDDYSKKLDSTTVLYSPGNEQAAATVAAALGSPQVERVTGMGQTVHVVLAADFAGVSTPPPSGSQVSVNVTHSADATPTELPEDLTVTNGADTSCE